MTLTDREQEILTLAWELGRAYGQTEVAEAIEQVRGLPALVPAPRPWAQQVADRIAEYERYARAYYRRTGRREWLGLEHGDEVTPWT